MKADAMSISQRGIDFIKSAEGLRTKAYQDSVGVWTIGYGSTKGVARGLVITEQDAEARLVKDLAIHERFVKSLVTADISQAQYDALTSLVFNIGTGAFAESTLLRELNQGNYNEAALWFCRWCRGDKAVLPGLLRRRMQEAEVFLFGWS